MSSLTDKVTVVTGGSSGIGQREAERLEKRPVHANETVTRTLERKGNLFAYFVPGSV